MSIVYYALGGGYGHVARAIKVINALSLPKSEIQLLVSDIPAFVEIPGIQIHQVPEKATQNPQVLLQWLRQFFENKPERIYLDTFPCGILCELNDYEFTCPVDHIARILKPEYLEAVSRIPVFENCFCVEELAAYQYQLLSDRSRLIQNLLLSFEFPRLELEVPEGKKSVLIVHSGSEDERMVLVEYARDVVASLNVQAQYFVTGNRLRITSEDELEYIQSSEARQYLASADVVVSACGFNIMHEMQNMKDKHYCFPMERRFDDQFLRKKLML